MSGIHPLIGSKGAATGPGIMRLIQDQGYRHDLWVEPFVGSGALLIEGVKAGLAVPGQICINDLNSWAMTTVRVLRSRPDELRAALELTPLSQSEHDRTPVADWSDVELACWWLHRSFSGYVGKFRQSRFAIDRHPTNYRGRKWDKLPGNVPLLAELLRGCTVFEEDALQFIRRVCQGDRRPLLVCDPPYVDCEDSYRIVWRGHEDLAELLHEVRAEGVVVCYQDHPLIRSLYSERFWQWHRFERASSAALALHDNGRPLRTEVVLIRR